MARYVAWSQKVKPTNWDMAGLPSDIVVVLAFKNMFQKETKIHSLAVLPDQSQKMSWSPLCNISASEIVKFAVRQVLACCGTVFWPLTEDWRGPRFTDQGSQHTGHYEGRGLTWLKHCKWVFKICKYDDGKLFLIVCLINSFTFLPPKKIFWRSPHKLNCLQNHLIFLV